MNKKATYSCVLEVSTGHFSDMLTAVIPSNTYGIPGFITALIPRRAFHTIAKYITSTTSIPIGAANAT